MSKSGTVFVIVAPSGTGKSTIINKLKTEYPALKESISYTTRAPRGSEQNGREYFFTSLENFKTMIDAGQFIEWAKVHNNFYGTSKIFIESMLGQGHSLLLDIDVQGADEIKKHFPQNSKVIFLAPPSLEVLEKRLRGRATDTEEVIRTRIENARKELAKKQEYDYLVVNDNLDRAYGEVSAIIKSNL